MMEARIPLHTMYPVVAWVALLTELASGISILSFGLIPGTLPEPFKIGKTGQRARSYLDRDPMLTSTTQEYPLLIDTFFMAYTFNGEFLRDDDWRIYFESGSASRSGVCGDEEKGADHQDDEDEDGDGDT
nr:hypothetical protein [Tanacetum cinerariifolium]